MSLFILVHGESGVGKTRFACTAPKPCLVSDFELGADFIEDRQKTEWNPQKQDPRELGDDLDLVIVPTTNYDTFERTKQWMNSGAHPFNSWVLDSGTEHQKRVIDKFFGVVQMREQDWGMLLRYGEQDVRMLRDSKKHAVRPLQAVVLTAQTSDRQHGLLGPHLVGQLATTIKAFPDVTGYLFINQDQESGWMTRWLQIVPLNNVVAKDRTNVFVKQYGNAIPIAQTSPDGKETRQLATIETLLEVQKQHGKL